MANLSNINNILRISSSGVGLNKDNIGPSELDIESAGADMIDMTRTGQKTYRLAISGTSTFSVFDVAANADRLAILTGGNVGIGVAAPNDGRLQVYGNSSSDWGTYIWNQHANGIGLHVETSSYGTEQLLRLSSVTGAGGGNSVRMVVRADGNVGIGTDSPEVKLSIDYTAAELPTSGTTSNSAIQLTSSLNNQLNLGLNTVSGGYGAYIQASDNNLAVPYPLNLQPNGGNVGIGTTTPNAKLHIYGSASLSEMYLGEDAAADKAGILKYTQGNGSGTGVVTLSHWGNNSLTEGLAIKYGGNVGIGTTSPYGKLTIQEVQAANKGDFDFQQIVYNGGWSANVDGLAAIQWSDGVGSSNTIGRIGVTYTGSQGEFQIKDLYSGGYAGSGKVFTVRGDGQAYFSGNVGIGTTSPNRPLTIQSNSGATAVSIYARSQDDYGFIQFFGYNQTTLWSEIAGRPSNLSFIKILMKF